MAHVKSIDFNLQSGEIYETTIVLEDSNPFRVASSVSYNNHDNNLFLDITYGSGSTTETVRESVDFGRIGSPSPDILCDDSALKIIERSNGGTTDLGRSFVSSLDGEPYPPPRLSPGPPNPAGGNNQWGLGVESLAMTRISSGVYDVQLTIISGPSFEVVGQDLNVIHKTTNDKVIEIYASRVPSPSTRTARFRIDFSEYNDCGASVFLIENGAPQAGDYDIKSVLFKL